MLTVDAAKSLQPTGDMIQLPKGITALSKDAAKELASRKAQILWLQPLTELDGEAAAAIASFPGKLYLDGLKHNSMVTPPQFLYQCS